MSEAGQTADIKDKLTDYARNLSRAREDITFTEYLDRAIDKPSIACLSHERIYNMILSNGMDEDGNYLLFRDELFGLEEQIKAVVDYFKSAARRLDTRKRILLLHGPVSSAKSTLVDILKKGLEEYSLTDEGAMYGIKGCPMHEEPLHLVPSPMRRELLENHGIYIEGKLCPRCQYRLENEFDGDFTRFTVERVIISEQGRVGIGTFLPSDPKSQDITELVGSINFSKIAEVGTESNPLAFTFDGELNISNRGLMEFIEMLKADEKFLYVLLTLTQEQIIKAPRFPRIYSDVAIIAHTNEAEFREFSADDRSEALQDRIIKIDFPYNLRVSEEVKIYEKLLRGTRTSKHIAPRTLEVASVVAVLSRLDAENPQGMDRVKKMGLYNGSVPASESELRAVREASAREGMDGISPRYVANRIANALIQDDIECLTPVKMLKLLKEGLRGHAKFSETERREYVNVISRVGELYERMAEEAVKDAVVCSMGDSCQDLFDTYIANVDIHVNGSDRTDEFGNPVKADEGLMRDLERRMGIQENAKDAYRSQLLAKLATYAIRGERFTYDADGPLKKAIDEMLYEESKSQIKAITTVSLPNDGLKRRISTTVQRLKEEAGYCDVCAGELLKFVGSVLSRPEADGKDDGAEKEAS